METLGYLEFDDAKESFGLDCIFNPLNSGKPQRFNRETAGDEIIIAGRETEVPKREEEGEERAAIDSVTDAIGERERKTRKKEKWAKVYNQKLIEISTKHFILIVVDI